MPSVTGSGYQGNALTCNHGTWNTPAGTRTSSSGTARTRSCRPTRASAPRARRTTGTRPLPVDPTYGTQAQTSTDSLLVGEGDTYTPTAEDVGKVVHCAVSADNAGATVWKTAVAPEILSATNTDRRRRHGSGHAEPHARRPGLVRRRSRPGITKTYESATTANVDLDRR